MAVTDEQWTLAEAIWPDTGSDGIALAYDSPTDTLFADLFGRPLPAVTEPLDGSSGAVSLRIQWDGNDVVGLMVEGYVKRAVKMHPTWLALAPFAEPAVAALLDADIPAPAIGNRTAIVESFLADVKAIWTANVEAERRVAVG